MSDFNPPILCFIDYFLYYSNGKRFYATIWKIGKVLIITRTPYRLALAGGGTDFAEFYQENEGQVVSFTFDKFCFITLRYLPQFFEHKFRIVYNKIEVTQSISEIEHPAVKSILRKNSVGAGIELHHDGDLPARSGVGSSSAFVVGLSVALNALKGINLSKKDLALQAIDIEQNELKEKVGVQDQIASAYGGINSINIRKSGDFFVKPIVITYKKKTLISDSILLVFSKIQRNSTLIHQATPFIDRDKYLDLMNKNKEHAIFLTRLLESNENLDSIADIFNESWEIKKSLNPNAVTPELEELRQKCLKAGAKGVKIMGAGGGGFLALWINPEEREKIKKNLGELLVVPIAITNSGSEVIFNSNSSKGVFK